MYIYRAIRSSKPDHRTVGSHTFLFLSQWRLMTAVSGRSNVYGVSVCHGAVDGAMLCAVTAMHRALCTNTTLITAAAVLC